MEYVGILYTLFSFDEKSKDGMTPFRKLKGRDWVISLPSFGECVDYRVRTQHKLEQDGTLVFIWVLDCIQLRRSLEPHKESLWYSLLDANRQINSGMQT